MEDAGAKRQMFYDIECVIDDCDGDVEYKPLSDSDELDECAEEDEQREEDIEWEPLMRSSRAKRQQHGTALASGPRRRGRPRKHQPSSPTADRSSPKYCPNSSSQLPRRGRPPKDKSKMILTPKPSCYPMIIPKPDLYSTPLPNPLTSIKVRPNSTSIPFSNNIPNIKFSPNSSLIPTPNPASISFSNSINVPLCNTVSGNTFASNSLPILSPNPTPAVKPSPDSTHTISANPNPTLICTPAQTSLLLDMDTNRISDLWRKRATPGEEVDSVKEQMAEIQPKCLTSSTLTAKRQRLSPPAITPARRRGRPRKHALKITSSSSDEPTTTSNAIIKPAAHSKPTSEPTTTSNPIIEPAAHSKPTSEPTTTSNPIIEPAAHSKPTSEPTTTSNPIIEPAAHSKPTSEPTTTSNPIIEPAAHSKPTSEPTTSTKPIIEPAAHSKPTSEPTTSTNPIIEPAAHSKPTSEPTTSTNPIIEPAVHSKPTSEPTTTSNLIIEPAAHSKPTTTEPTTTLNHADDPTTESIAVSNPTVEPVIVSNLTPAEPLANSDLDEDSSSDDISGSEEEDLREDCVESAEDWKPPMEQHPDRSTLPPSTAQSMRSVKHASHQQRDMSSESTCAPEPVCEPSSITMASPSAPDPQNPSIPEPTSERSTQPPRRRGRPRKRTLNVPIKPPDSKTTDPKTTPTRPSRTREKSPSTPTTPPLDLLPPNLINAPETDKWHDVTVEDKEPKVPDFCPKRPPGPQLTEATRTPLQLFQLFFTSSVIETIVRNTNSYAEKRTDWVPLAVNEFFSYLALVLYMGLVKVNTLMDYWATKAIYRFPYPQSVMSRERFQAIFSNLHLSDPRDDAEKGTAGYDRLLKIKPLYTDIVSACKTHFHPDREIFIHEKLDATKSRCGLKPFLNDKTNKSRYKLMVLADSSSGYNWNVCVYDGERPRSMGKGVAYDSVMKLLDLELLGKGYRLYTDSFFTCPTLFGDLVQNDILACGFLHHNFGFPKVKGSSSKAADRGSIRWCRRGALLFVRWTDTREMITCSTMHKAFESRSASHQISLPPSVKDCSKYMRDEDSSDALIMDHNVLNKTSKWYKTFFFQFLEIAVINAYVLHQHMAKTQNETPLSQKAFRETLISELERVGRDEKPSDPTTPSGTDPWSPASSVQTEQCMPEYMRSDASLGRKTCVMCRLSGENVKTPIFCSRCKVPLCCVSTRNCFMKWHIEGHSKKM